MGRDGTVLAAVLGFGTVLAVAAVTVAANVFDVDVGLLQAILTGGAIAAVLVLMWLGRSRRQAA